MLLILNNPSSVFMRQRSSSLFSNWRQIYTTWMHLEFLSISASTSSECPLDINQQHAVHESPLSLWPQFCSAIFASIQASTNFDYSYDISSAAPCSVSLVASVSAHAQRLKNGCNDRNIIGHINNRNYNITYAFNQNIKFLKQKNHWTTQSIACILARWS